MTANIDIEKLKAGKTFTETIAASNQASAELRNNIRIAGLTRIGVIAAATLVVIIASWLVIHFHYESRFEKARLGVVGRVIEQVEDNQAILNELAKANRRLELSRGESGTKLLAISNARGYTSTSKAGMIEFK